MSNQKWYLHVDLDAFFASVEQLDHPEYRGKPLIVGAKPEDKRGVVSTASYEARKFGVHSAMPIYQAYKLCPQGIYVYGRMDRYAELSYQIMNIFRDFSPDVEQMSIDEAFIDITGTEKLFGPPEETAFKIKAKVKQMTGLTVSIGLAGNKYLAKIASGLSKPDGFYFVKPGTEQEFMLQLPLEKLWGVGEKTREALKRSGILTIRNIYETKLETLQFLYGNATGQYLYDAVRGKEASTFSRKVKSHSISAETTFSFDVIDSYTAETKLLELCHGVMFRLLKENAYSKTAHLKIRYEDFSTVSIQKTLDNYILTVDSYFEIIKSLFETKYENGRGIRLLGVGFENIDATPKPQQQSLFDDGTEKRQIVEKAILNIEKKHPEIKIHKARTLTSTGKKITSIILGTFLLAMPCKKLYAQNAAAITNTQAPQEKSLNHLFNWKITDNTNIDFSFSGYYKALIEGNIRSTFGYKNPFTSAFTVPIFKQEIDLSALIKFTPNWYFDLEFQDEFSYNTYTLGYKSDSFLDEFKFSNRNISFPAKYSASQFGYGLGGGKNEAPGIYVHLKDPLHQKYESDFILRYDMTTTNSATYYGNNLATDSKINLSNYKISKEFVLPESQNVIEISDIFIEAPDGDFLDSAKRKYKKLNKSQYLLIPSKKLIVLSEAIDIKTENQRPQILLTFNSETAFNNVITATGDYTNTDSFLGKIQNFFNTNKNNSIDLKSYTADFQTKIDNKSALIIQSSAGFCPFLNASNYDCGIFPNGDLMVISAASEAKSKIYTAEEYTNEYFNYQDFFIENHLYATLKNELYNNSDLSEPENRFPLADEYPYTYLMADSNNPYLLLIRTYTPSPYFDIGKKAAGGTVTAYINGIIDAGARYDSDSGFVTLSQSVSELDKIYITWQEQGISYQNGAFIAGAGFIYNFTPNLNSDFAITSRIPFSPYTKYGDYNNSENSFAAITAGLNYENKNIQVSEKISLSVSTPNITGTFLAYHQTQSSNQTYYLGLTSGFKTNIIPVLNSDTYSTPVLLQQNNGTVNSFTGVEDSDITGYKIPLTFDFQNINNGETCWASTDIKLPYGSLLKNSSDFEIAFYNDALGFDGDVYLQLGIKAETDFTGENSDFISLWKLTGNEDPRIISGFKNNTSGWQIVKIHLNSEDRTKLLSAYDLRLIIVKENIQPTSKKSGTIYTGPYQPCISPAFLNYDKSYIADAQSFLDISSPSSKKYLAEDSYFTSINWTNLNPVIADDKTFITEESYFEPADFSHYKYINYDFNYAGQKQIPYTNSNDEFLIFELLENSDEANENTAVKLILNQNARFFITQKELWHTLKISLIDNQIYIDEIPLPSDSYKVEIYKDKIPSKKVISFNTAGKSELFQTGIFNSGNIYYTDNTTDLNLNNYTAFNYHNDKALVKINDYDLIKKAEIKIDTEELLSSPVEKNTYKKDFTTSSNASGKITIADIIFHGHTKATSSAANNNFYFQNSGHNIQTETNLFKILSFGDNYNINSAENSLQKNDFIKLNFKSFNLPLTLSAKFYAKDNYFGQNQNSLLQLDFYKDFSGFVPSIDFEIQTDQKIKFTDITAFTNKENYFIGFSDISKLQFSKGETNANFRKINLKSAAGLKIPYAGLAPKLIYSINGQYKNSSEKTYTDNTSFNFEVPFNIAENNFSFAYYKHSQNSKTNITASDYYEDAHTILQLQKSEDWFYKAIPIYDFFDSNLSKFVQQSLLTASSYDSKFSFTWKRNLSNTFKDLFLPFNTSFDFTRTIQTGENISDFYQIRATASNMAINVFGSNGNMPLFNWYTQDEFDSSFTTALKIPKDNPKDLTMLISAYTSCLFFIDSNNQIKAGFDTSFQDSTNWNIRLTGLWNHSGNSTLLITLPSLLFKQLNEIDFNIYRKESFNTNISKSQNILKQEYTLSHGIDIKFAKHISLSSTLSTGFSSTEDRIMSLLLEYNLSGKIEF